MSQLFKPRLMGRNWHDPFIVGGFRMDVRLWFIVGAFGSALIPGLVASYRGARHESAIWTFSALTGWTGVGFVVCLIWAISSSKESHSGKWGQQRRGEWR